MSKGSLDKDSRNFAIARGNTIYKSKKPCPRGHVGYRRTYNFSCEQCNKERDRRRWADGSAQKAARKRYLKRYKERPQFYVFDRAQGRARRKGIEFNITVEDVDTIWPYENVCPILGLELIPNIGNTAPADNSPSLDRIDPNRGYVKGNIAIISYRANMIKSVAFGPEELRKVANWLEEVMTPEETPKPSSK